MDFRDVVNAVADERDYQRQRWGADKQQSLAGYLLIMKAELDEAIDGWMKNSTERRDSCLEEVVQVVATGFACLETYGIKGCSRSTNDITEAQLREERLAAAERRLGAR
jgi:hypothetical protein